MKYVILILIFSNLFTSCNIILPRKKRENVLNFGNSFKNGEFIRKIDKKTKKYGFVDSLGNKKIEFIYDYVDNFSYNFAVVYINNQSFYIDTSGNKVFQKTFCELYSFKNKLAIVKDKGQIYYGVIDLNSNYVIQPKYDELYSFSNELFIFRLNNKFGLVNSNNKEIIDTNNNFTSIKFLENKLLFIKNDSLYSIYNVKGERISGFEFQDISDINSKIIRVKKNNKYGLFNNLGKVLLPIEYDFISNRPSENILKIEKFNKYGTCNLNGEILIHPEFDMLGNMKDGYIVAKKDKKWGYVDSLGNKKILFNYDYAKDFINGPAIVNKDHKSGIINKKEEIIFPISNYRIKRLPKNNLLIIADSLKKVRIFKENGELFTSSIYDFAFIEYKFINNLLKLKLNSKYGFINSKGKTVIDFKYDEAEIYEKYIVVTINQKTGIIDFQNNIILPIKYNEIYGSSFRDIFFLKNDGKYGLFKKNQIMIEPEYEYLGEPHKKHIIAKKNGKYGLISYDEHQILDLKYDDIDYEDMGNGFSLLIDNKWGFYDISKEKIILNPKYSSIKAFYGGAAIIVSNGDKKGLFNNNKDLILPVEYDDIKCYPDGIKIIKNDKLGYVLKNGKIVLEPIYDEIEHLSYEKAKVLINGKWKIIIWDDK